MKEIKEEIKREVTDVNISYEAIDGTRFVSKEECQKYENSAKGVLRARLKELEVCRESEWELIKGDDDCVVIGLKITTQEDADVVMQAFFLDNPWYLDNDSENTKEWIEERRAMVNDALQHKDILLMGLNCDDELYFIDSRVSFIERLNNLYNKDNA